MRFAHDVWTLMRQILRLGQAGQQLEDVRAEFDEAYYLQQNPDVAEAGIDPFQHFLKDGWKEGRNPNTEFFAADYLAYYDDVRAADVNPFCHFIWYGRGEKRSGNPYDTRPPRNSSPPPQQLTTETRSQQPVIVPLLEAYQGDIEADIAAIEPFFDTAFYADSYKETASWIGRLEEHYLRSGAQQMFDPNREFSTKYYCVNNPDLAKSGMNPFVHYCQHGRHELREPQSYMEKMRSTFQPLVSVIVPNYNHARFLPERISSIANQTYRNIELIILDDKSTDNSREVIESISSELKIDVRTIFNETNSGGVFAQWKKGVSLAKGELVWICESDDFCEPEFLEKLIPHFVDQSVSIAFGRIQFCDSEGKFFAGLDAYRERAEGGIWNTSIKRPAFEWFNNGFGVNNVIANVGGCVFRNLELPEEVWASAATFRICGDWFLYIHLAGSGQICFESEAISYFRQHNANSSATNFDKRFYYDENVRILFELAHHWGIALSTRQRFLESVRSQYHHFGLQEKLGDFDNVFDVKGAMLAERKRSHVQVYFLGFHTGGGELFAINLANALLDAGFQVSVAAMEMHSMNSDMRTALNPRIAVYARHQIFESGRSKFFDSAGVSVIHSHIVSADAFLASEANSIERPYVVTLHGSYLPVHNERKEMLSWILSNVGVWVYTADRNLKFFESKTARNPNFIKLPNAMPRDEREPNFTRDDHGILDDDIVFSFVARGIKRKGWRAAINAFRLLRAESTAARKAHLILVGDGDMAEQMKARAEHLKHVHFLGYQSAINGILRLSDCLLLPTRFEGESFPLVLIQALQEGVPVIATDVGEIRSMMTRDKQTAGIVMDEQRNTDDFTATLKTAMRRMLEDAQARKKFADVARECGRTYDMNSLVCRYREIYLRAEATHERSQMAAGGERSVSMSSD